MVYGESEARQQVGLAYLQEVIDADITNVLSKRVLHKHKEKITNFVFVDTSAFFAEFRRELMRKADLILYASESGKVSPLVLEELKNAEPETKKVFWLLSEKESNLAEIREVAKREEFFVLIESPAKQEAVSEFLLNVLK